MASGQSGTEMKRNADAGTSPDRNKETQSGTGILHNRAEMMNAGIPMPAASADANDQLWRW